MENNQNNHILRKYDIEARRNVVASMLARSMTEEEIAEQLQIDQTTVSRDIRVLKEMSNRFIFDLAKSDLAYYYRSCIDGIEAVKRRAWQIADMSDDDKKIALTALRLAKDCDIARFELFTNGPSVLNVKSLQDRIGIIEERNNGQGNGNGH